MFRLLGFAIALALGVCSALTSAQAASERTLPMRFELRQQDGCTDCAPWISASGAITADTPRDFIKFVDGRELRGAIVTLDSDGGSVLGAIALGREIRRLNLATAVGRALEAKGDTAGGPRAILSPRADCESMCTFVLLAGVRRHVPAEARVMVHQIWLGDRREDPTAASYSAEDLVLVQRDIGRLAQYTAEMGGPSELLELSLKIPPWEPMHAMTRDELRRMRLDTEDVPVAQQGAPVATSTTVPPPSPAATSGTRASAISDRRWAMADRSGTNTLARRHPLTVEGDEIGRFDLSVSCTGVDAYSVAYTERRTGSDTRKAQPVSAVTLRVGGVYATLKVVSSEKRDDGIQTFASGAVPYDMIKSFAVAGPRSLVVTTTSGELRTVIRLGNTGVGQSLPQLASTCSTPAAVNRADIAVPKTGGIAANQ